MNSVMRGIELSSLIAIEVLGLHASPLEYWSTVGGDVTGLKVATRLSHLPHEGYFRPDVSFWQSKLVRYAIFEGSLGKAKVEVEHLPGSKIRFSITDGEIETEFKVKWDIDENRENALECILAFARDSKVFKPLGAE